MFSISQGYLRRVKNNAFVRDGVRLRVARNHCQHLVQIQWIKTRLSLPNTKVKRVEPDSQLNQGASLRAICRHDNGPSEV